MFSPIALLTLLCFATLFLFGDRGCISSNAITGDEQGSIRHDFGISVAESGWVFAAGMIGLAISAPASAHLSTSTNALRLVGLGIFFASAGSFGTAVSSSFPMLLAFRVIAGMGSGPFISLASPLIDDSAPQHRRSAFLACLFVCIPIGFSGGYIYSTLIASKYGWRTVFLLEGICMAPFAAIALLIRNPNDISRGSHGQETEGEGVLISPQKTGFFKGVRIILRLPALVLTMLALVCLNGSLGGFSFYGSKAAKSIFHLKSSTADLIFGISTVITGSLGTLLGGILLDSLGSNVKSALLLCILGVGTAAGALGFSFAATSKLWSFSPGFLIGQAALFTTSAPAVAVMLWASPANLRPTALAVSEILNHLLGDIPWPILLGLLQQRVGNWRLTMCMCTALLGCAAVMFAIARCAVTKELLDQGVDEVVVVAEGNRLHGRRGDEEEGVARSGGGGLEENVTPLEEPLLVSRE